jgi:hypothetical protein
LVPDAVAVPDPSAPLEDTSYTKLLESESPTVVVFEIDPRDMAATNSG